MFWINRSYAKRNVVMKKGRPLASVANAVMCMKLKLTTSEAEE